MVVHTPRRGGALWAAANSVVYTPLGTAVATCEVNFELSKAKV